MTAVQLITENIDLWTSAIKAKSTQGRGSSKKLELYGIKKLRELILELAVRGKLVPQDSNDEPASVLLDQIAAEKALQAKEGNIKRPKKLTEISDGEKPFELPNGWSWARFGEVFEMEYGDNLPEAKRSNTGEYPVYGSNGVVGSHEECSVNQPCIIIGRKGSAGALNLCPDGGCWVTDVAYSLVPPSGFDLNFTFKLLHTLGLDNLGKGIKPGLNRNEANTLLLCVPPIGEQYRIVAKVDELMTLCDQLEQQTEAAQDAHQFLVDALLESLTNAKDASELSENWGRLSEHFDTLITTDYTVDQLKQTILQLAVMGKLVPQDSTDEPVSELLKRIAAEKEQLIKEKKIAKQKPLPEITDEEKLFSLPKGWEWCRIDTASLHSEAGWSPKCHGFAREKNAWGVLKISAVTWGEFKPQENKQLPDNLEPRPEYEVRENDFLISRANTPELVARSVVVPAGTEEKLMMSDKIIRFVFSKHVSPNYLNLVNNSQWSRNYYARVAGGTSSSMKNVSRNQIQMLVVALPPLEEQNRITSKTDQLMALCDRLKARLSEAQTTQLYLADTVINDVLGVPAINIENAEVNTQAMRITTVLSLNHEEFGDNAVIAPILLEAGGSADAKDVWSKTELSLPEFYAQLKIEIDAKYIVRPARADFKEA